MKQGEIKKYGSVLFSIIFLILIIWYLKKNADVLFSLKNLSITDILIIGMIQPITISLNSLINQMIIKELGFNIDFKDIFFLQYVNGLLNKLIAEGGAVYRGSYLKTVYSFPISSFLVLNGAGYLITLLVNAVMGLLFYLLISMNSHLGNYYILAFFLFTTITTILLLFLTPKLNGNNWLFERLRRVLQGWNRIKQKPLLIASIILLSLVISLLQAVTIYMAFRGLKGNIGIVNAIFYSSLTSLVNFINITPGGLGIIEGSLMFSYQVIGLPVSIILLGALVIRAINFIVSVLFGSVSYIFLQKKLYK